MNASTARLSCCVFRMRAHVRARDETFRLPRDRGGGGFELGVSARNFIFLISSLEPQGFCARAFFSGGVSTLAKWRRFCAAVCRLISLLVPLKL